jgi:hypothetical protein
MFLTGRYSLTREFELTWIGSRSVAWDQHLRNSLTWNVIAFIRLQVRVISDYRASCKGDRLPPRSLLRLALCVWAIVLPPLHSPLLSRRSHSFPAGAAFFRSFVQLSMFRGVRYDSKAGSTHACYVITRNTKQARSPKPTECVDGLSARVICLKAVSARVMGVSERSRFSNTHQRKFVSS